MMRVGERASSFALTFYCYNTVVSLLQAAKAPEKTEDRNLEEKSMILLRWFRVYLFTKKNSDEIVRFPAVSHHGTR
jgi:hypothetical protein